MQFKALNPKWDSGDAHAGKVSDEWKLTTSSGTDDQRSQSSWRKFFGF